MNFHLSIVILISLCPMVTYSTSKFTGVCWCNLTKKWSAKVHWKNKRYAGGLYEDELEAAKRVNELCENLGIERKNPEIGAMPTPKIPNFCASQYKGVNWDASTKKWRTIVCWKHNQYEGGKFSDELDAAKRINQLCDELGIKRKNPGVNGLPLCPPKFRNSTPYSQYIGVLWHRYNQKWKAELHWKKKLYKDGYYENEQDAAKRINAFCDELGIERKNPGVDGAPPVTNIKNSKSSEYKGVTWDSKYKKWRTLVCWNKKTYSGGHHDNEQNAAKRANQICDELGIERKNPGVDAMLNKEKQQQKNLTSLKSEKIEQENINNLKRKRLQFREEQNIELLLNEQHATEETEFNETIALAEECITHLLDNVIQTEFEDLINILDENNKTSSANLIKSIRHEQKETNINFQTNHGESALSLAAQYGFSNIVKILISTGAQKEHFTNEHHTPLSLAVSQNHLKVVEVLLEDWISPNSHEEPYIYLAPIFNVKSEAMAQILVDNDAVTNGIYNENYQTPLTVACQNGLLDVVEFFLNDGLDINHLDNNNKTPLFYALTNQHYDVVNFLISQGAQNISEKAFSLSRRRSM